MLEVLSKLNTSTIHQLHASDKWAKVRQLVHEKAYRTTGFSIEMIRTAKAQADLENKFSVANLTTQFISSNTLKIEDTTDENYTEVLESW